jgi:hypothetical protein
MAIDTRRKSVLLTFTLVLAVGRDDPLVIAELAFYKPTGDLDLAEGKSGCCWASCDRDRIVECIGQQPVGLDLRSVGRGGEDDFAHY